MNKIKSIRLEELNPNVRKAGMQNYSLKKNRVRRIYDHEFLFCIKGKAYAEIEGTKHDIVPGSLILIKPDIPHRLWSEPDSPADIYWIHFDFLFRKDIINLNELVSLKNHILFKNELAHRHYLRSGIQFHNGYVFPEHMNLSHDTRIKEIFKRILQCYNFKEPFWQMESKILLLQLFKIILEEGDCPIRANFTGNNAVTDTIISFIHENYFRKITMKEISKITGLCVDYAGRLFKRETSESIVCFTNRVRISHARELLKNSTLSVENVADQVGFSDMFYFSKVMKKYEGISPQKWRKQFYEQDLIRK